MKTYVFTNRVYPPVGGATGELLKELAEGLAGDGARVVVVTSKEMGAGSGERGAGDRSQGAGDGEEINSREKAQEEDREQGTGDGGQTGGPVEYAGPVKLSSDSATSRAEHSTGQEDLRLTNLKLKTPTGVEVIRVGTATFTRASHGRRAWSYLTLYPQLMWQVWKLGRVDAVVSMTDPPLQVAAVTLASCRAGKKIHWAQDVYPELAEELGVIPRGGLLARVLRAVSNWALRRQDEVVVVGRCMRERLVRRGVDAGKIEVIPNWSPVAAVPAEDVAAMRQKLGWDGKFVALYSGNLGLAHDFETLVGAAKLLEGAGVTMVFAGEGPRLEEVKRTTAGCKHVAFLPSQPKEHLSAFLAAADVHLVTVRAGLEGLVVPSKAYGILAAGRPIFFVGGADSEVAGVIAESGCGVVIPNGDAAGLAEAIKLAARRGEQPTSSPAAGFDRALTQWRAILS
jgi:colanic acid biosynthesis glycosyl transferase WcaI